MIGNSSDCPTIPYVVQQVEQCFVQRLLESTGLHYRKISSKICNKMKTEKSYCRKAVWLFYRFGVDRKIKM